MLDIRVNTGLLWIHADLHRVVNTSVKALENVLPSELAITPFDRDKDIQETNCGGPHSNSGPIEGGGRKQVKRRGEDDRTGTPRHVTELHVIFFGKIRVIYFLRANRRL